MRTIVQWLDCTGFALQSPHGAEFEAEIASVDY